MIALSAWASRRLGTIALVLPSVWLLLVVAAKLIEAARIDERLVSDLARTR